MALGMQGVCLTSQGTFKKGKGSFPGASISISPVSVSSEASAKRNRLEGDSSPLQMHQQQAKSKQRKGHKSIATCVLRAAQGS